MTKVLVGNLGSYTFDASAQTVTLTGFDPLDIEQILLITNVKDGSNEIIYQFDLTTKAGTIAANVITLVFNTTLMADTDDLQIWVDIDTPIKTEYSRKNAAVSAYLEPKVASERDVKSFKYSDAVLQINFIQTTQGIGSFSTTDTGQLLITTGAQATSGETFRTKAAITQPVGRGILLRIPVIFPNAGVVGNVRAFGLYDGTDGFCIRLNGTALEFVTTKGGVDTVVNASTWDTPVAPDTNIHLWEIQTKSASSGDFDIYLDKVKVHSIKNIGSGATSFSDKNDLPLHLSNNNSTNTTDLALGIGPTLLIEEGKSVTIINDGERDITINAARRLNVQSGFSYLMSAEFDIAIDQVNIWDVTTAGSGSFVQPANSYTIELKNTTGATDNIEVKTRLLNLKAGAGEFATFEVGLRFGTNNPTNHVKEWGYKDSVNLNGVFFRLEDGVFKFVLLKGGVENVTEIDQAKPNANFHNFRIEHLGAGKIIGSIINQGQVIDFSPAAISQVGSSEKQPFIRSYNTGVTASTPDDLEAHWIRLLDTSGSAFVIRGKDDTNVFRDVAVNSSRRLLISQEPPVPPPGTTQLQLIGDNPLDLGGTNNSYVNFAIPNGSDLALQNLYVSFEGNNAQSKVEIYDDPLGVDATGPNLGDNIPASWVLITIVHIENNTANSPLNENVLYTGDGTRRIILRRKRLDGGNRELYAKLDGYY